MSVPPAWPEWTWKALVMPAATQKPHSQARALEELPCQVFVLIVQLQIGVRGEMKTVWDRKDSVSTSGP